MRNPSSKAYAIRRKSIIAEPKELISIVRSVRTDISESRWCCPICKQWDKEKNMVPATLNGWLGKAHLKCIEKYNETHAPKYSIREYDEKNKFLGKATPI